MNNFTIDKKKLIESQDQKIKSIINSTSLLDINTLDVPIFVYYVMFN